MGHDFFQQMVRCRGSLLAVLEAVFLPSAGHCLAHVADLVAGPDPERLPFLRAVAEHLLGGRVVQYQGSNNSGLVEKVAIENQTVGFQPGEVDSKPLGSPQAQLLLPSRTDTAMIVGAALVVPMLFVHLAGFIKVKMDLTGHLRLFLQSSLFRKYLNYSRLDENGAFGGLHFWC